MNVDPVHVRAFGPTALLAEVDDAAAALALATWLREQGVAATELVPAARTVLLDGLDPADLGGARALLAGWRDEPTARDDATGSTLRPDGGYSACYSRAYHASKRASTL